MVAEFLGKPALFPTAPWLIASVLKVPVCLAFGLYHGGNRYSLEFETFADAIDIPRQQRKTAVAALIQRYAARLEHYARQAPYNWFNFYDFWGSDSEDSTSEHIPADGHRIAHAPPGEPDVGVVVDCAAVDRAADDGSAVQQRGVGRG